MAKTKPDLKIVENYQLNLNDDYLGNFLKILTAEEII